MFERKSERDIFASVVPLGFILIIAILSLALLSFQATTVPQLNEESEIRAQNEIETDFVRLDSTIYRVATNGIQQPFLLGEPVRYPPNLQPIQRPNPTLRTIGPYQAKIDNTIYAQNATDFIKTRQTNSIVYEPNFNYFENARSFGYEHGIFYTASPNSSKGNSSVLIRDEQTLIDDQTITLVSLKSDVDFSSQSPARLSISEDSQKEFNTEIRNQFGSEVTITLPTRLAESYWQDLLESEKSENGGTSLTLNTQHSIQILELRKTMLTT